MSIFSKLMVRLTQNFFGDIFNKFVVQNFFFKSCRIFWPRRIFYQVQFFCENRVFQGVLGYWCNNLNNFCKKHYFDTWGRALESWDIIEHDKSICKTKWTAMNPFRSSECTQSSYFYENLKENLLLIILATWTCS